MNYNLLPFVSLSHEPTPFSLTVEMQRHPEQFKFITHGPYTIVIWKRHPRPGEVVYVRRKGRYRQAVYEKDHKRRYCCMVKRDRPVLLDPARVAGVIVEFRFRFPFAKVD
jgi:hypothetical protein